MEEKIQTMKFKLVLGVISLIIGFIAANLAFFHWHQQDTIYYLMGEYARYACGYGGFAAMILGSMLINDFYNFRKYLKETSDSNNSIFGK